MFSGHDYNTTETVDIPFNTFSSDDPSASVTVTNLAAGDIKIHKDGSVTQRSSASGVTVSVDFDGITGCHVAHIDLSDNTDAGYYANGSRYQVRVEGITVDAATLNPWIGTFSVGCTLRPAIDGRTIGVESDGDLTKVNTLDGHTAQSANNNTILAHADYGLAKLLRTGANGDTGKTLSDQIDGVPTVGEIQTEIEENGASVIDTIRDYIENVTYGLSALKTLIDGIPTTAENAAAVKTALEAVGSHLALIKTQTDLVTSARMGVLTDWINDGRLDLLLDAIKAKADNLPSGIAKNKALPFFDFYMLLADGLTAATGKTITGQIRKDNGAFTAITNVISEIGSGLYAIASGFIQAEMNADKITLKFTADACKDTIIVIYPT